MCRGAYTYVQNICGGQLKCHSQALPSLFYFFEMRVLIGLELTNRVRWLASKPRGLACLCFPSAGVTSTHSMPRFLLFSHGFWETNSGPHTLQTKLFPQPPDHTLAKAQCPEDGTGADSSLCLNTQSCGGGQQDTHPGPWSPHISLSHVPASLLASHPGTEGRIHKRSPTRDRETPAQCSYVSREGGP